MLSAHARALFYALDPGAGSQTPDTLTVSTAAVAAICRGKPAPLLAELAAIGIAARRTQRTWRIDLLLGRELLSQGVGQPRRPAR